MESNNYKPSSKSTAKLKVSVNWRGVFAEAMIISATILLAFAVQDWDEGKDIEERTLIALCNVKSELEFNRILIIKDLKPRQKGMLALANASISSAQTGGNLELNNSDLKSMMLQQSLRYSAWTLASESGYLLHANFQLATEIGALLDFQRERYQSINERVYDAVYDRQGLVEDEPVRYLRHVVDLSNEWISQTDYLLQRYDALFSRDDFNELPCN